MDSQDNLWLARECGLEPRIVEFRGGVITSLGIREGFLYKRMFEGAWDLKVKTGCMSFLFCCNKSHKLSGFK